MGSLRGSAGTWGVLFPWLQPPRFPALGLANKDREDASLWPQRPCGVTGFRTGSGTSDRIGFSGSCLL